MVSFHNGGGLSVDPQKDLHSKLSCSTPRMVQKKEKNNEMIAFTEINFEVIKWLAVVISQTA